MSFTGSLNVVLVLVLHNVSKVYALETTAIFTNESKESLFGFGCTLSCSKIFCSPKRCQNGNPRSVISYSTMAQLLRIAFS